MALIPSIFPPPIRDGYSGAFSREPKRFQMEDSQYLNDQQSIRKVFNYSLTWKLTFKLAELFEAWVEYGLSQGVDYFSFNFAGKLITVRPSTGMPSYTPAGAKWLVSMDVEELRAAPVISVSTGFIPVWPSTLPSFESAEYSIGKVNAVTKSDLENGVSDERVRFQDRVTEFGGKIICNQTQRDLFWSFYQDTLINGASYFMAPFANAHTVANQRSRIVDGTVTETSLNSWYAISFRLETLANPIISKSQYLSQIGI